MPKLHFDDEDVYGHLFPSSDDGAEFGGSRAGPVGMGMKPMGRVLRGVLLSLGATVALAGNGVRVPNAFVTGQQFIGLSESARTQYVMGLIDGIFVGTLFGASEARVAALQSCLMGRNNIQVGSILLKYVQEHPEQWHEGAHALFYQRMIALCPAARPS
jgi:hypothetical protein